MALFEDFKLKLGIWLLFIVLYLSNLTVRLKVIGKDKIKNLEDTPLLYSFWHRYIWLTAYHFRFRNFVTLASLSHDGEYITRIIDKLGWQVVRGSSSKGGARSLIKLARKIKQGDSVVLTPDGPTGPIFKVKPGIVYLQEKSDSYIIPLGYAVKWKKVVNSWDKFVIPLPFSRAVLVIGEPVKLSTDKSIEERCLLLEEEMKKVQIKAENQLK